ncbi:uncharacterized protein TNCV_451281 [Trichonephila clavipes]|nr:uncharacterized protein TNCV_451281 [Trichonephila clavipes]
MCSGNFMHEPTTRSGAEWTVLLAETPREARHLNTFSLVVRASDSRLEGLGSMLDVTKYPPSAHGFTCRNCGDRGRVAIYCPFGEVSLSLNRTVTCMVLKANDRRTSCPCHDEFRGPRSEYVRQVALATTTKNEK